MKRPSRLHTMNTGYDPEDACSYHDASDIGNNQFSYLTKAQSHAYRDEKDWEADIHELNFDDAGDW